MIIPRLLKTKILTDLNDYKKGIVIYGPRQAGKTTLVSDIIKKLNIKTLILNGDLHGIWWDTITSRDLSKIKLLIDGYDLIFIDEAQRIPEIGISIKIILDNFPQKKVIITGSSSLDLSSKISEPLTGRVRTYKLYPISHTELELIKTPFEMMEMREERIIYGSYPEIFSLSSGQAKSEYLQFLIEAYLYKDLLEFGGIRNSNKIFDLLRLLAFQVGSEVSIAELSRSLELNKETVNRYLDLLEKSFVIYRLSGYSRNLRKEVSKMDKIYFYDTGVRNAMIGNFLPLSQRDDGGKLWENFLINERIKKQKYLNLNESKYFWRLSSGAEIDFVEEIDGKLFGYEFKFSNKIVKSPLSWKTTYLKASFETVNLDNYLYFITNKTEN